MKSVIRFNGEKCEHCLKCLKACPSDAISIEDGYVHIEEDKCIHCDICIQSCVENKLSAKGDHLGDSFSLYEYKIALLPTSILSDVKNFNEIKNITMAIKKLGFDEVVQYSDIEGALYNQSIIDAKKNDGVWITSFCPTINRLIENEYPTLIDHLLPYEYPEEILAKELKEKYKDKKVGIYSICQCVAKLTLASQPFGNTKSNIDHAVTISHLFPRMNKFKNDDQMDIHFCKSGVKSITSDLYSQNHKSIIVVDGLDQVRSVLELIEFDRLEHVNLVALYACYQGCIGGYYLWSNPFEGVYKIEKTLDDCDLIERNLNSIKYHKEFELDDESLDYKERVAWFNKVNAILDTLPQFDCGSCGYANCRHLANKIAKGEASDSLCRVKKR